MPLTPKQFVAAAPVILVNTALLMMISPFSCPIRHTKKTSCRRQLAHHCFSVCLLVDLHPAEHLDECRIIVVHDLAVSQILAGDRCHLFIAQLEVPDVDVLFHPFHMHGFRDDGHAALRIPAKHDLSGALAMLLADR